MQPANAKIAAEAKEPARRTDTKGKTYGSPTVAAIRRREGTKEKNKTASEKGVRPEG